MSAGISGNRTLGRFDSFPVYLPPVINNNAEKSPIGGPPSFKLKEPGRGGNGGAEVVNTSVVIFAEASLSNWGFDTMQVR
jgi:hypothetical protein